MILPHFHPEAPATFSFLKLSFAVATAITLQVLSATTLGALLPITARACKLDPAVVSAPSLASIVDVSGMLIYFGTAAAILGL